MAKTAAKAGVAGALEFLARPDKHPLKSMCVVYGDDLYLKSEVLCALRKLVSSGSEGEFGVTTFTGREARLHEIRDALSSLSLFGDGQRVAIVQDADSFVTEYRTELEDYVAAPARGVLVLDVKSWPSNTRLAKALMTQGLAIQCDSPNERQTKSWLVERAKSTHQLRLEAAAADALVELVPPELGILAQELAKLALMAGADRTIDVKLVRENVGGWRARATWDMVDAAADGRAADALGQLGRLIASGEKPHALLPQMSSSLRRFATALELYESAEADGRRILPRDALSQAGVLPFKLTHAERQFRQIGRHRAHHLTEWLLAADLAIKGHHSSDDRARIEIERLIVRLASTGKEQESARAAHAAASK